MMKGREGRQAVLHAKLTSSCTTENKKLLMARYFSLHIAYGSFYLAYINGVHLHLRSWAGYRQLPSWLIGSLSAYFFNPCPPHVCYDKSLTWLQSKSKVYHIE